MENIFKNNIYVLFGIIIYYLLISERPKYIEQKIIILYLFMTILSIFNILNYIYMSIIFVLCLFIYFEYLIEDEKKLKLFNSLSLKIFDFLYLLIIRFNYLVFFLMLYLYISSEGICSYIFFAFFILAYICIITIIINKDFEVYDFTTIYEKINKINFGNFIELNKSQKEILLFVEDKSFFKRSHSYTFFSFQFLIYRFYRIKEIIDKIESGKNKKHKFFQFFTFIKYVFQQLFSFFRELIFNFSSIKRFVRGYSTIDMQLIRTISISNGYEKIISRKIFELVYAPLFFKGLKQHYKLNYKSVTDDYYKNFLLLNYIYYAPLLIANKNVPIESFWRKKINKINNSEFLLSVLSLSGKLKFKMLDFDIVNKNFEFYIRKFNIDKIELKKAIKRMKYICEHNYKFKKS